MNCYAAFAKDESIRMSGSSGGIYPVLSNRFIKENGIIYAAIYNDSLKVTFARIDNKDELAKTFTSKYMQARLDDTFKNVASDLRSGKRVLFCGTPCQVSGLKAFLGETKCNTNNLLLLDFICHGVPSEDVFSKYLERFSENKCTSLNMRNKENGWIYGNYSWKMGFADGSYQLEKQSSVSYMKSFISSLSLRPSCYECKLKGTSFADITLGDFWGIDTVIKDIDCKKGVSCIISRSEKGEEYLKSIQSELQVYQVKYDDILVSNSCLEHAVRRPFYRKKFFRKYKSAHDFDAFVNKLSSPSFKLRLINKAYSMLPHRKASAKELICNGSHLIFRKKEQCCGCTACLSVCSLNAIVLKKDS